MSDADKTSILFLCTGNSCRSQMAEGWARQLHGDLYNVYSAGIETHGLNPLAAKVMAEAGVDISKHTSTLVEDLPVQEFDYVITVCDHAHESCPIFPGSAKIIHHQFPDPPRLAAACKTAEEALTHYRKVRDLIKEFMQELPGFLERQEKTQ